MGSSANRASDSSPGAQVAASRRPALATSGPRRRARVPPCARRASPRVPRSPPSPGAGRPASPRTRGWRQPDALGLRDGAVLVFWPPRGLGRASRGGLRGGVGLASHLAMLSSAAFACRAFAGLLGRPRGLRGGVGGALVPPGRPWPRRSRRLGERERPGGSRVVGGLARCRASASWRSHRAAPVPASLPPPPAPGAAVRRSPVRRTSSASCCAASRARRCADLSRSALPREWPLDDVGGLGLRRGEAGGVRAQARGPWSPAGSSRAPSGDAPRAARHAAGLPATRPRARSRRRCSCHTAAWGSCPPPGAHRTVESGLFGLRSRYVTRLLPRCATSRLVGARTLAARAGGADQP